MKNKKLTALILAVIMLFTCMVPAYAAGEAQTVAETESASSFSIIKIIKDFFHSIIERIFDIFGVECPFCEEDYVPVYIEEAVAKYNDGVNAIKNYTGRVTVKKTEAVAATVRDLPSVAEAVISAVAETLTGTNVYRWDFDGGKTSDGVAVTDKIEPCGRQAALDAAGVILTESVALDNGGEKVRIVLMPETSVYDGTAVTQEAIYNAGVLSTVNYATLDLGPIAVYNAETTYTETVFEAEYDSQGRIVNLKISAPMEIWFTAKAVISISGTVNADVVTEYKFTYWS